ncbi:MAG: 4-hydroxy-3-methylbut-2-enyl diphosphate reductase [Lachnospiraceae bacterium]|nr:4-hydroxy-3-methylbut-2-enyl diphosphate reductase [Lachnospiraceae bacterium]
MEVIVAKTAGFCFGVRRAVDQVYRQIEEGKKPIYTYGPIIHNEEVVRELEEKGVHVLNNEEELSSIRDGTVIIRSHGVPRRIYDLIEKNNLHMVDATCPFVRKIHRIVEEKSRAGSAIVIIGNEGHPEVEGIKGWSCGPVTVISTEEEAEGFQPDPAIPLTIVSQTTFNYKKFDKLVEILLKMRYDTIDVMCTICNATEERQSEAREIAERADCMIVIGGTHSSNTRKLFEICKTECANTYYIQTLKDLDIRLLPSMGCVGITAGASTPNKLIEEVSKHVRNEF